MTALIRPPQSDKPKEPYWLLRRADQAAVGGIALIAMLVLGAHWFQQWRQGRGVIDIEHATPRVATFQVDVNAAQWPEIAQIPEVGETLARRIVETRAAGGPYRDLADLRRRVKGVGPKTLEKITPFVAPFGPDRIKIASQTDPSRNAD